MRRIVLVGVLMLLLGAPAGASADSSRAVLQHYARDTWASLVAMTDEQSGLPADSFASDGTRSVQTSTTNIGAYMWSAVVAERLVLQLVRPSHGSQAHHLATDGSAAHADPLVGGQRLARHRAASGGARGAGARRSRGSALQQHGLRLLLPAGRQSDR